MANVEISKKLVLVNSIGTVILRVVQVGLWFWLNYFLVNHFKPDVYQLIPVLMMGVMSFVQLIAPLLVPGIARYAVEAYARGDERRVTQIVSSMFAVLFAVSCVVLVVGLLFSWFIDCFLTIPPEHLSDARAMMAILIVAFCVRLPLLAFNIGPFMKQRFILRNSLELASQILNIALVVFLLFGVSVRIIWVPFAQGVAMLAEALVHSVISMRIVPAIRFRISEIRMDIVRELSRFGRWYFIGRVGDMLRDSIDPLVLNKFSGDAQVDAFYVGTMGDRQIRGFMLSAMDPLRPALTAMHATDDRESLGNAYLRCNRIALWLSLFLAVPLIVLSRDFFGLFLKPEKFELFCPSAIYVMMLVLGTYPLMFAVSMLEPVSTATAKMRAFTVANVLGQGARLLLTIWLVGFLGMGALGAGWSIFIGTSVMSIIFCIVGLRLLDLRLTRFLWETLLPGILPGAIGALVWWQTKSFIEPTSWLRLIACGMIGGLAYLAVLPFCLRKADWNDAKRVLNRLRRKKFSQPAQPAN